MVHCSSAVARMSGTCLSRAFRSPRTNHANRPRDPRSTASDCKHHGAMSEWDLASKDEPSCRQSSAVPGVTSAQASALDHIADIKHNKDQSKTLLQQCKIMRDLT